MNIVLANQCFAEPGGSETYLLTVGEQLERLGHSVLIFADSLGPMADFATRRGLTVTSDPAGLEDRCDAVIAQDSVLAYRLAEHHPHAPQLFRACTEVYDSHLPPSLPGVVAAVVVCNDRVGRRIASMATRHVIRRLRQPIDTERFMPAGSLPAVPRRAILLGNYLRGPRLEALRAAFARLAVEVRQIGAGAEVTYSPERVIWEADIVVGKNRAALEGMACGKAVFIYDQFGADGWVTAERYAAMEADNFMGQAFAPLVGIDNLEAELRRYSPEMGVVNRELAITYHLARAHAQELSTLLAELREPDDHRAAPLLELSRMARVQWQNAIRAILFEDACRSAREAGQRAQAEVARLQAANAVLTQEVERLRAVSATRRVRLGLGLGRFADTVRRTRVPSTPRD